MNALKQFYSVALGFWWAMLLCSGKAASPTNLPAFAQGVAANVELPAHIQAPEGKLSMVADYAAANDTGVPVYIVNKTNKAVIIPNQDGDIYLKLETRDKSGRWIRAQTHRYSDCGNSYGARSLASSMHLRVLGYRPVKGTSATVRYALHSSLPLACAEGPGVILQSDVEAARVDSMSVRHVPRCLRDAFELEWSDKSLSASDLADRLVLLQQLGGAPALRNGAEAQLQKWKEAPELKPDELAAVKVFEHLLKEPWTEDSSPERLLRHCLSVVSNGGSSATLRSICWSTISDLAQLTFSNHTALKPVTGEWLAAVRLAATQIVGANDRDAAGMRSLLNLNPLVDNTLRDVELEPLLNSKHGIHAAANAMARRGLSERLCELASQLSMDHQVVAMASIACGGRSYYDEGIETWAGIEVPIEKSKAEALWKNVMAQAPLEAVEALRYLQPFDRGADAFGPIVANGLRDFWTRESRRQDQAEVALPNGGYSWRVGLEFLARAKDKRDVPLFQGLLHYGGFEPQEGSKSGPDGKSIPFRARRFGVREAAVAALRSMGVQVPDDVVLQADVSNPDNVIVKRTGDKD